MSQYTDAYDRYSLDECHIECRNWTEHIEMNIKCVDRAEAGERMAEEVARGAWDKIYLYGYWPVIRGDSMCYYFTGVEDVWNKPEVNPYNVKRIEA